MYKKHNTLQKKCESSADADTLTRWTQHNTDHTLLTHQG